MLNFAYWYLIIGGLLIFLVAVSSRLKRLPLTTAMLYLAVGWLLGTAGWLRIDPLKDHVLIERLSELAVIISLFAAGLHLRVAVRRDLWRMPVFLASLSMAATVGLITLTGTWLLGLPLGVAIILGGALAPTDPVLASDVQVEHPNDTERVRFTLTGEAALNDGMAFPFVMLGLGVLGLHELGAWNWRWVAVDVVWAVVGGLGIGALLGTVVGRTILYLRCRHREAVGLNDFLALGLIAVAYGTALVLHAYGFLAVFAAGLSLRIQGDLAGDNQSGIPCAPDADAESPAASMADSIRGFNAQLERIAEMALVLVTGAILCHTRPSPMILAFAAILFLVIRPLAIAPVAAFERWHVVPTGLLCWFGIRGIGSIYYIFYAIGKGVPDSFAQSLIDAAVWTVVPSICAHGVTVTPVMRAYDRIRKSGEARAQK